MAKIDNVSGANLLARCVVSKVLPEIDSEECSGCGDCVEKCPTQAVALVGGKAIIVRPEDCDYCTECEVLCPSGAVSCPLEIILVETEPEHPWKK